jgi:hypothetical protein
MVVALARAVAAAAARAERIEQCVAATGFDNHVACIAPTSGLGECNMCCTAIANCTIDNARGLMQKHWALTEDEACHGLCGTDFNWGRAAGFEA